MWFLSSRKARRNASVRSGRNTFRPKLEALEDRCLLSAGSLDPTFGNGGTVQTPLSLGRVNLPMVMQPDGKIVVGSSLNGQFALERFNSNGTIDTTFNGGNPSNVSGIVSSALTANGDTIAGLALDASGDIIAVGKATIPVQGKATDQEIAIARYKTDGSLDSSFGGKGYVLLNVNPYSKNSSGGYEDAIAAAVQGDGKIAVGGYICRLAGDNIYYYQFILLRYNSDGTIDTTFGNQSPKNGINITAPFGAGATGDFPMAMALQTDGKILLAGSRMASGNASVPRCLTVARYTTAGQLDSSFGTGGTVTLAPSGTQSSDNVSNVFGVLVQTNSAIVLSGDYDGNLILARLQSNGQVDSTFANAGFATSSAAFLAGAVVQGANGDLLTETWSNSGSVGVAAFLPTGALDTSFGTGGFSMAAFSGSAFPGVVAIQSDGKIVIAAATSSGGAVARFVPSNTQVGWMSATPNPVSAGASATLTVSNIYDTAYPITSISQVSFYQDINGNGTPDGADLLLGTGTLNSTTGVWAFTLSMNGLSKGTYTFFAQAGDGNGLYAPVSIQVTVQ
jgi:uncharacterized delta-60 repeat protein